MLKRTAPVAVGLSCALILLLLTSLASAGFDEKTSDKILHVMNDANPLDGVETVVLEEAWRKGGEDGEDFFGMVSQVLTADDGTIYLLDTRLSEVSVYSPDGERLDTLSREGEGPGETRGPSNMLFMPDGTLGLVQVFPGRVVKVARDGTPAGEFRPGGDDPTAGGFVRIFDCTSNGSEMIVTAEKFAQGEPGVQVRTNFVAMFGTDGIEKSRFCEHEAQLDLNAFELNEDERKLITFRRVAAGRDGRVYIARSRNAYAIEVYTADGQLERIIERAFKRRRRSDVEYERVKASYETRLARVPNHKVTVSRTHPDIASIEIGHDGNLWVASSRSSIDQPDGVMFTWDLFSPDGHFIKQVSAVCPGDGEEDLLIWTPSGDSVMVTGFRDARRNMRDGGGDPEDESGSGEPMEVIYLRRVSG